jgi:hypothetical protein
MDARMLEIARAIGRLIAREQFKSISEEQTRAALPDTLRTIANEEL